MKMLSLFGLMICVTCLCGIMSGCGSSEQQYSQQTPAPPPTPMDNLRSWLEGVAQTGEIDSGADAIREILPNVDAPNKDQLAKDFDALVATNNPMQVKSKANAMLQSLPPMN